MGRDDEVRLIAYRIWEEEGCPNGRDCEHWFRAEIIWEQQQKEKAGPKHGVQSQVSSRRVTRAPRKK